MQTQCATAVHRDSEAQQLSLGPALPSPTNEAASITALAIDQSGRLLAAGCSDKTVRLWRLADLQLLACWYALCSTCMRARSWTAAGHSAACHRSAGL